MPRATLAPDAVVPFRQYAVIVNDTGLAAARAAGGTGGRGRGFRAQFWTKKRVPIATTYRSDRLPLSDSRFIRR